MGHLSSKVKKHTTSKNHIESCYKLAILGDSDIASAIDSGYALSIKKHNDEVTKNRHIMNKLIDCIKFCGSFELALRGHDESSDSINPGIFRGLVDFVAEIDGVLSEHLEHATVFKGTSHIIQDELLQCMLEVLRSHIKTELQAATFVAIQSDDTTDVSCKAQNVLVFRYVDPQGDLVERFYAFTNLASGSAEAITASIRSHLDPLFPNAADKAKVIAQSYDGASVMSGEISGVQTRIRQHYPHAYFVHCFAHQLNLIMKQAVSGESLARIFFSDLSGITVFFARSSANKAVLEEIVHKSLPRGGDTRWNFNSRSVNVVFENLEKIGECFESIANLRGADSGRVAQARGYQRTLEDREFLFFLYFFHDIMYCVDLLYNQLQKRDIDTVSVERFTNEFVTSIERIRAKVPSIIPRLPSYAVIARRAPAVTELERVANVVCDIVKETARERFKFTGHLVSAKLFNFDQFGNYDRNFPTALVDATVKAYPMLEKERLSSELAVMYAEPKIRKKYKDAHSLLKHFCETNVQEVFKETRALLTIMVTTPMASAEAERCFSTLKRIKTFLRNTMGQERLNALAMLTAEKRLVASIVDFNEQVIDRFAAMKDRRIKLIFKQRI